jgi:hypothetical protein
MVAVDVNEIEHPLENHQTRTESRCVGKGERRGALTAVGQVALDDHADLVVGTYVRQKGLPVEDRCGGSDLFPDDGVAGHVRNVVEQRLLRGLRRPVVGGLRHLAAGDERAHDDERCEGSNWAEMDQWLPRDVDLHGCPLLS